MPLFERCEGGEPRGGAREGEPAGLVMSVSEAAAELLRSDYTTGDKWETAAIWFLEKNPEVLSYFISLARSRVVVIKAENAQRIRNGKPTHKPRVGAKWIAEQLRNTERVVEQCDDHGFKINNNHVTTFAKLAVRRAPDLEPYFRFRKPKPRPDHLVASCP